MENGTISGDEFEKEEGILRDMCSDFKELWLFLSVLLRHWSNR